MARSELPNLDATRCTGCGACVQVCPSECLESWEMRPRLARPRDCLSCTLCVLICPVQALRMLAVEQA